MTLQMLFFARATYNIVLLFVVAFGCNKKERIFVTKMQMQGNRDSPANGTDVLKLLFLIPQ